MVTLMDRINLSRMKFNRAPLTPDEVAGDDDFEEIMTEELSLDELPEIDQIIDDLHRRLEEGVDMDKILWYNSGDN